MSVGQRARRSHRFDAFNRQCQILYPLRKNFGHQAPRRLRAERDLRRRQPVHLAHGDLPPNASQRLAGRSGRSLQLSRQSISERHREAWLGRFAMHADATNQIQQITRDLLRPIWRRSRTQFARSCTHNKTAKNRFALCFSCHSGPAKAAPRSCGT